MQTYSNRDQSNLTSVLFLRLVSLSVNEAFNYLHRQLLAADKLDQQHHVASGNWLIKSDLEAICFTAVF